MKRGPALILSLAVFLFGAAPAMAAVRYATPAGTNTSDPNCTNPAPANPADACTIVHALNDVLTTDDELVLAPGDYGSQGTPIPTPLYSPAGGALVHALPGHRARIFVDPGPFTPAVNLNSGDATLRDVEVVDTNASGWALNVSGTTERVIARAGAWGCEFFGTVIDTLCVGGADGIHFASGGSSPQQTLHITVRNVTAIGTAGYGINLSPGNYINADMEATNVIARGGTKDLYVSNTPTQSAATINIGYSNYATTDFSGLNSSIHQYPAGTDQGAPPLFVNAGAGNFAEAAGSPTINAGANSSANGLLDLAGLPRRIGPHTDVGAYERVLAPSVTTGTPSAVASRTVRINGQVNPNGAATTYQVRYGTRVTLGSFSAARHLQAGVLTLPVSTGLKNLKPGTTYHYRLVAGNFAGSTVGPDRTFTTRPDTEISDAKIGSGTAAFKFRAVGHATKLQCSLHRRGAKTKFTKCKSPKGYKKLGPGKYTFEVRAVGVSGGDPSPAKKKFRIH